MPGRRARLVTVLTVLSLAVGIAGNAVVFSLIQAFVLRPLPYPEPERVVLLGQREAGQPDLAILSLASSSAVWADYREQSRTLTDWAAFSPTHFGRSLGEGSVSVSGAEVTPSLLRVLGARPARGRLFADDEGVEGGPKLAILDWDYWRNTIGAETDPIGLVLTLDGEPHEVVGVLPEGFDFLLPADVWVPLQEDPRWISRNSRNIVSVARMVPGATMAQVEAEAAAIAERIASEHPEFRGWTMDAMNLRDEIPDPQSRLYMAVIQAAVLAVLLIACGNIANLLLARGEERKREIAIRTALGATRLRIVRQLLGESMLLAATGGAAGLTAAAVAIRLIAGRLTGVVPPMWHPALDPGVVVFTVAVTALCGLAFGLMPALLSLPRDPVEALKRGGGGAGVGRRRGRMAAGLVVAEIALSLVALGAGSVLIRGFLDLLGRDPGYRAERLLLVPFGIPAWKHDAGSGALVLEELRARASALTGVAAAAVVWPPPEQLFVSGDTFRVEGAAVEAGVDAPRAVAVRASPGYARTLGVPVLRGRFFEDGDREGAPPVAVLSRATAERHFPGRSPVGDRIVFDGEAREIVGVVGDVQLSIAPRPRGGGDEAVYLALGQAYRSRAALVLRATGDPLALAAPIRAEIGRVDPDVTVHAIETVEQATGRYTTSIDVFNAILGGFAILALLLAALGTYGVVAYSTAQRTHEIGVRLAVGARPRDVVTLVARRGVGMAAVGLAAGAVVLVPVILVVRRVQREFALAPVDPFTLAAAAGVLFLAALAASFLPARRAAAVDPVRVLKAE